MTDYPPITDQQRDMVTRIREATMQLVNLIHIIGNTHPGTDVMANRDLDLAESFIRTGEMWAVRHITNTRGED